MNNEDFVTYKTAQALKKCGFDWPCSHYYTKENAADDEVWITPSAFSLEDWNNSRNAEPDFCKPICSAPTLYSAQKWLRKTKGIEVVVEPRYCNYKHIGYDWHIYDDCSGDYSLRAPLPFCDSYEYALSAGIEAALKLIEEGEG